MSTEWPVDNEINDTDVPPPVQDDIEDDDEGGKNSGG